MNPNQETTLKHTLVVLSFVVLAIIVFGLLWLFFLSPANPTGLGWFIFSFAAGLSMIVLPCTLPLAFVIVPLSMGKGVKRGFGIALAFAVGITITLSLYGVIAAIVGRLAIDSLGAPLETVKNWVYFIAGIFALLFALSEIGLLKFRMPSYTGAAPAFIQKQQDFIKALLLGMFLGNIGVGCPHPATPLILIEIASSGNVLYGWLLFLIHAIGRVLPLMFLAVLGILGVNGLSWLVARREKVERATGWAMVFVAGFILTLGLFSHAWWVNSGIHTTLEKITHEESLLNIVKENLNSTVSHAHGLEVGTGLFGLPLWLGNWFLVALWVIPIWWWWFRKKQEIKQLTETIMIPEKQSAQSLLGSKKYLFVVLTAFLALVFIYTLPHNFLKHQALEGDHAHEPGTPEVHPHAEEDEHHMDSDEHALMMSNDSGAHEGHEALFHEEHTVNDGLVVNLTNQAKIVAGQETTLSFFVNTLPTKTPVLDLDLQHEKFIHVIGVRDNLTNFFHIHPFDEGAGNWVVPHIFNQNGTYKIYSDVTRVGVTHSFGHPLIEVINPSEASSTEVTTQIEFFKNIVVDKYQVALSHPEPIVMGRDTHLDFTLTDFTGNGIVLEPYLGADMHLAVISDDLVTYLHTHPASHGSQSDHHDEAGDDHSAPHDHSFLPTIKTALAHGVAEEDILPAEHVGFVINFPQAGVYKLFGQFRPAGLDLPIDESLVAQFYVKVATTGPLYLGSESEADHHHDEPPFSRGTLVLISLGLIIILGFGSHRFINVKS